MKNPRRHQISEFLRAAKDAFQDHREKYDQFLKVVEDYRSRRIHVSVFKAKLKSLFEGHKYSLLRLNNLLPKEHRLESGFHTTLPPPPWDQLPWDVLHVISQKLDFDDLFQFSRVCTNWRVFHKSIDKSNFLTSQEPLLLELEILTVPPHKVPYSFISLTNQKVYRLKKIMTNMMSYSEVSIPPIYVTYSSGYFVFIADNSSFVLINPFTQIKKKVICPPTFKFSYYSAYKYRALLAFEKCSEEFVLVFLFRKSANCLHVYQSRDNAWVTYSTAIGNPVVDFVAFNNKIHVVTKNGEIGVLSLNSANIEFLKMGNSLELDIMFSSLNLVTCDEQLLVVQLNSGIVDKIDFSTMTYVKLNNLGDIALFYVCCKSCKALSNPNRWGYDSNSVYDVCAQFPNIIHVYNWDKKSEKYIEPPNPKTPNPKTDPKTEYMIFDWCFRHLKYEVDYSL